MNCRICGEPFAQDSEPISPDPETGEERLKVVVCLYCGEISIIEATTYGLISREPSLQELTNIARFLWPALVQLREERAQNPPPIA